MFATTSRCIILCCSSKTQHMDNRNIKLEQATVIMKVSIACEMRTLPQRLIIPFQYTVLNSKLVGTHFLVIHVNVL